jgi:raffinose/stachyose/melibiose transport system substrate-binding protein
VSPTLPFQYNIEGIFYNKAIFEENGWAVPETWDDLLTVAGEAKAAGLTAFAASGEQGWPLTRLVSGYLFRTLGADALQKVADGDAKLTDPEYVEAAQAIADLGAQGYFGDNVASLDYDAASNEFLTGKAAMIYMGSWLLGNINSDANQIGADNVGFMPFPAVDGGAGSIDEYPSNVGLPATFNAKTYAADNNVGAWLKCITENYGNEALKQGQITGFVADDTSIELPAISQTIKDTIDTSTDSVLWFEALFNAKASSISSTNAALLVTGQMTPEEFMTTVQDALDQG